MSVTREIRLVERGDGQWTATDEELGITVRGDSRSDALAKLDAVVAERLEDDESEPLGRRLRGMAGDLDVDSVADVRDVREHV